MVLPDRHATSHIKEGVGAKLSGNCTNPITNRINRRRCFAKMFRASGCMSPSQNEAVANDWSNAIKVPTLQQNIFIAISLTCHSAGALPPKKKCRHLHEAKTLRDLGRSLRQ